MTNSVKYPSSFGVKISRTGNRVLSRLLRPHPLETRRGTRYEEEARSERLANLVRIIFTIVWTSLSGVWGIFNTPLYTVFNLGIGVIWIVFAILLHVWLSHRAYSPLCKYLTTTVDILLAVILMICYAVAEGPIFMFKMPIFINLFYALGFAALRFNRDLVLYATALAVGALGSMWLWLQIVVGIDYGTRHEHTFAGKLNIFYTMDILLYTGMFGFLTATIVMNLKRHMDLRVAVAERAAREEERATMAAGLAHEIRNPLGSIHGFAQLLRDEGRGTLRYAEAILDDARRLNGVVEGFLRFTRPFSARPSAVDVIDLVDNFCREDSAVHPDSPLDFKSGCASLWMRTDAGAIRQILHNLVRNARRYQPAGSLVRVRVSGSGEKVFIEVEDDGPGVSPEILPNLFKPFQTSGQGGTGLGLSLSRKFARELNGDLYHVERRDDLPGTCFVLILRPFQGQGDV